MALNSVLSVTVLVLISDLNNPLTVYVCYKTSQSMTYLNSFRNKIIVSPSVQLPFNELGQRKMLASLGTCV